MKPQDDDTYAPAPVPNDCPDDNCDHAAKSGEALAGHMQSRHGG